MSFKMLASALAPRVASAGLAAARATAGGQPATLLPRFASLSSSAAAASSLAGAGSAFRAVGGCFGSSVNGLMTTSSRAISVSAVNNSAALADMLQRELDYEKENYEKPELAKAPAGWKLEENAGDTHITLTKQHNDETIQVDVMVNNQPDADGGSPFAEDEDMEEEEEDVDVGVVFNVSVTKGDKALVFECKSDGAYFDIEHCSLEPANEDDVDESKYTGPVYHELDEELQNAFRAYLAERGVDPELGGHVLQLVHDKEQREYMTWLGTVKSFVNP